MADRLLLVVACCLGISAPATGQAAPNEFTTNRQRPSSGTVPSVLDRFIAIDVENVTLSAALDRIADAATTEITIEGASTAVFSTRVSLHAQHITVSAALAQVLRGTHLHAELSSGGVPVIVRDLPREGATLTPSPSVAVVLGRIVDADSRAPIGNATVSLTPTARTTSDLSGRYKFAGVAVGQYTLRVRALGYVELARAVTVPSKDTTVEDFALVLSKVVLDQVVTTATGNQQLRSMGNTIGTIQADSVVATAPVMDLGDLINARVPGVQVFESGGLTGASPQINIRGQNSLSVSDQPLLYVDGVRVANSAAGNAPDGSNGTSSGRFDDIAPEDIESIEIVRGPSAATLYGTDAANGVILITTKHGAAGHRRLDIFSELGTLGYDRSRFPQSYYAWGHTLDGTDTPTACPLASQAVGQCALDSLTHFSPIAFGPTSPIGTGNRANLGAQLSGGNTDTRYFLSGSYENETGYLRMPPADQATFEAERGGEGLTNEQLRPNAVERFNIRENLNTSLGGAADLSISSSYQTSESRIPYSQALAFGTIGPGYRDANNGWFAGLSAGDFFLTRNDEGTTHFTTSGTTNWRPFSWLTSHATAGVDFSSSLYDALSQEGDNNFFDFTGYRGNTKTNTHVYAFDVGATATADLSSDLTSHFSVGGQYNRQEVQVNVAAASDLLPGCTTVLCGNTLKPSEASTESIVAGAYGEEMIAWRKRLFLTGAVRVDGASAFGTEFHTAVYPKASASWLVSDESFWPANPVVSSLRLRSAYGQSGVQPDALAALAQLQLFNSLVDDTSATGARFLSIGNPKLKPERQAETEVGADIDVLRNRVHVEATYYNKKSSDALYDVPLGPSIGGGTQTENVGSVRNWGYEALVTFHVLEFSAAVLDLTANGSINHNQLLTLGPNIAQTYNSGGNYSIVTGYPLFSYFDFPIQSYSDANHDGVIEPSEVTLGTTPRYIGQAYPTGQLSVGTHLALLHGLLAFNVLVDYRGGFKLLNTSLANQCLVGSCREELDPKTSLANQASAVALTNSSDYWGFYQDGSFTRLREVSATLTMPHSFARTLHARTATLTVAGRNLALWTKYTGVDPEVNSSVGGTGFAFNDYGGIPPARYWIIRLNLGI